MLLSMLPPVGRDAHLYVDQDPGDGTDLWEDVQSHRSLNVSLNLMRGAVADDMAALSVSVYQDAWRQILHAGGLGFVSISGPRDISAIVHEAAWETRWQADFVFATAFASRTQLDSIASVEITNSGTGEVISVPPA